MRYSGELESFPQEIVEKMLYYQVKQGNKEDITVFERCIIKSKGGKGFDWKDTKEGWVFWNRVIAQKLFKVFFEQYPKQTPSMEIIKPYEQLKDELKLCLENSDIEVAHIDADIALTYIALNIDLTKTQRRELVDMYNKVKKYYA